MTLDNDDDATPNGGVGTTLGFTSNFINRLTKSRGQLESYVESNKRVADDYVTALRTIQVNEQQDIDNLIRQLKSLQYERGVVAAEEAGSDSGGVAVQRKELDKRQVLLQDELTLLKTKNHIEQSQLDGAFIILFSLCDYYFLSATSFSHNSMPSSLLDLTTTCVLQTTNTTQTHKRGYKPRGNRS